MINALKHKNKSEKPDMSISTPEGSNDDKPRKLQKPELTEKENNCCDCATD